MAGTPDTFIGRQAELQYFDERLAEHQSHIELLHTPFIQYTGPEGVGRTSLLHELMRRCVDAGVPFVPYAGQGAAASEGTQALTAQLQQGPLVLGVEMDELTSSQLEMLDLNLNYNV